MQIEYETLINHASQTRTANCTEDEAISAAMDHLDADKTDDGYRYHADEIDENIDVSRRPMIKAGAAILDGAHDWYSLWCPNY